MYRSPTNKLGCTVYEAEGVLRRALKLYPGLKEVKLFNAFRYFYHDSLSKEVLEAAMVMKENCIRMTQGRMNRVGHNWEACVEWFIDKFTTGATFKTQSHRGSRMDLRRITLHLLKSVGGRKYNAEVDRVWEVTPGVFAQPITRVLYTIVFISAMFSWRNSFLPSVSIALHSISGTYVPQLGQYFSSLN